MPAATAQRPIRQLLLGTLFIVLAYIFVAAMSALGGTCSIVLGHRHGRGHPLGNSHWWRRRDEMEQPA